MQTLLVWKTVDLILVISECVLLLEEAMRLKSFQVNKKTLQDNKSKEKNGSGYFRGIFSKRDKNGAKQFGNGQTSDKNVDKLPSLNVTGHKKVIQGAQADDYDAEISRLFKDQKVNISSKSDVHKGDDDNDLVTNGFEDDKESARSLDKTHHGKKKKKRQRKEERMSYTSSPNTAVTPTAWVSMNCQLKCWLTHCWRKCWSSAFNVIIMIVSG